MRRSRWESTGCSSRYNSIAPQCRCPERRGRFHSRSWTRRPDPSSLPRTRPHCTPLRRSSGGRVAIGRVDSSHRRSRGSDLLQTRSGRRTGSRLQSRPSCRAKGAFPPRPFRAPRRRRHRGKRSAVPPSVASVGRPPAASPAPSSIIVASVPEPLVGPSPDASGTAASPFPRPCELQWTAARAKAARVQEEQIFIARMMVARHCSTVHSARAPDVDMIGFSCDAT